MRRLRIAVYHNLQSGGAKRVVAQHMRFLAQRHDVTLFTLSSADQHFGFPTAELGVAVEVTPYRPWPWLASPFGRLNTLVGMANVSRLSRIARRTAARIDAGRYDVVLAHPCQFAQAPLPLRWLRTPALYYCHELPRLLYEPPIARPYSSHSRLQRAVDRLDPLPALCLAYYRAVDRAAARQASCVAVNSRFTAEQVRRAYHTEATLCYQGVDSDQFTPGGVRERIVLSVGSLTPAKGFDFLIKALASVAPALRPPLILISNAVHSRERAFLERLAKELGVELTCLLNVSDAELSGWYARAGCVAYAPIREPFGLVALEAMAAGAPLVAVTEGGVTETVIDGVTGRLAARDAVAFGNAVLRLLEQPEAAEQLARRARAHVCEHWTWERHLEQIEHMLYDIAKRADQS